MAEKAVVTREHRETAVDLTYSRTPQPEIVRWIETGLLDSHKMQDRMLVAIADALAGYEARGRAEASAEVTRLEGELAKLKARRFPILQPPKGGLRSIPWTMIEPFAGQAQDNHDQTLEGLASRGGLGALEALAVLRGVRYREVRGMSEEDAAVELAAMVKAFEAPTVASAELEDLKELTCVAVEFAMKDGLSALADSLYRRSDRIAAALGVKS